METIKEIANKNGQINLFINVNSFKTKCMGVKHILGLKGENMMGNGYIGKFFEK